MSLRKSHSSSLKAALFNNPNFPTELNDFEERDINWLFMFLTGDPPDEKQEDLIEIIIDRLRSRKIEVLEKTYDLDYVSIRELRSTNVISDIAWIQKDDHRLLIWLLTVIRATKHPRRNFLLKNRIEIGNISTENRYQRVVECIDAVFFDGHPSEKKDWLADLKVLWGKARTLDSDTKWLDANNIEQLKWAWQYLEDTPYRAKLEVLITPEEYYHAVLASLDCMYTSESDTRAERDLFLIKFRKAWSQKKFRADGKTKKPYHLPLTAKAKESLEKLAAIKNCNENDVLEDLINREYVAVCLDAQGHEKY